MAKGIPGAAIFGLPWLMVIPAPGVRGVLIGAACVPAIVGSLCMLVLARPATASLALRSRARQTRGSRARAVRAGSGMTRKIRRSGGDWIRRPIGARSRRRRHGAPRVP